MEPIQIKMKVPKLYKTPNYNYMLFTRNPIHLMCPMCAHVNIFNIKIQINQGE